MRILTLLTCVIVIYSCNKSNTQPEAPQDGVKEVADANTKIKGTWTLSRVIKKTSKRDQLNNVVISWVLPNGQVVDTLRDTTYPTNWIREFRNDYGYSATNSTDNTVFTGVYDITYNRPDLFLSFNKSNDLYKIELLTAGELMYSNKIVYSLNMSTVTTITENTYKK